MKRIIALSLVGMLSSFAVASDSDLKAEVEMLKKQMAELQKAQKAINIDALKAQISEVKAHDANDNIKFNVDFRTAYDVINYDRTGMDDKSGGVWTNKLILNMAAQPVDNLIFKGALQVYKLFGNNGGATGAMTGPYQNFDWFASETPDDNIVRLREAYFLYFGQMGELPYTASFGRRPSINGMTANFRDDDEASSPIGHNINMEFDGASFKFDVGEIADIEGMYLKLCLGRGNSNATGKYSATPYTSNNTVDAPNMDLVGLMAQLYNNGQYQVMFNYFKAFNVMGYDNMAGGTKFEDVGDLTGGALAILVDGIGDEISDYLDDTKAFASFAWSQTDPDNAAIGMLGSTKKETGTSYYIGVNAPCLLADDARIGLEYNHGSKYWRSFTYGEDTLIGSKLAARGDAYEAYWTKKLIGDYLSMQLRYTYIKYDYTGSDGFFGSYQGSVPVDVSLAPGATKSASNIRAYLRYRY